MLIIFETFRELGASDVDKLTRNEPSVINGVSVEKYRVTIEKIDEDAETYRERLQTLWDNTTNHYHANTIQRKAYDLGVELIGNHGIKL